MSSPKPKIDSDTNLKSNYLLESDSSQLGLVILFRLGIILNYVIILTTMSNKLFRVATFKTS